MGHWTGNGVIDFILNVVLILIVVVVVVWAIKELAPIFTDDTDDVGFIDLPSYIMGRF